MTNGELLIQTIEDVMGIEFDRSFDWKNMKHDVLIAFDGSWWRKEKEDESKCSETEFPTTQI